MTITCLTLSLRGNGKKKFDANQLRNNIKNREDNENQFKYEGLFLNGFNTVYYGIESSAILTINYMQDTVQDYGTYARFYNLEEADALLLLLQSNNIPYLVSKDANQLDPLIIGDSMDPMILVSIPSQYFAEVNQLVSESIEGIADQKHTESDQVNTSEAQPERLSIKWILVGYLFSILPIVGIFSGLTLIGTTKRLSNGKRIKMYDDNTRRHGWFMILLGVIVTVTWIFRRFLVVSEHYR